MVEIYLVTDVYSKDAFSKLIFCIKRRQRMRKISQPFILEKIVVGFDMT